MHAAIVLVPFSNLNAVYTEQYRCRCVFISENMNMSCNVNHTYHSVKYKSEKIRTCEVQFTDNVILELFFVPGVSNS